MSIATVTSVRTQRNGKASPGTIIPFDAINEPGAYVCNWSGHLMRVPDDGVCSGMTPLINIIGSEPLTVTKLCDDPFVPLMEAKKVARDHEIQVSF